MNSILSIARRYRAFTIFFLDLLLVTLGVYFSYLLRFDGVIPQGRYEGFLWFLGAALLVTPAVFYIFKLYRLPFSFISLTDLPAIAKGVLVSVFIVGTALFLFRDAPQLEGFPRSVIFLYAILLFLFAGGLRFSKRIYWQFFKGNPEVLRLGRDEVLLPLTSKFLNGDKPKTVLVTGGAGYIGSVIVSYLLEAQFKVKVYDKMLFGRESLASLASSPNLEIIEGDILDQKTLERAIVGIDAVVHAAAIVGEAACAAQQDVAIRTNYLGAVNMAKLAKAYGIKRFIYFSTCSTYGKSENEDTVDERSPLRPVDFYGETKIYAERDILRLTDERFAPTMLRLSTVYGLSPRMRFDLVVNTFAKKAVKEGRIMIFGGGQWRPLIHVTDVARAVALVLQAPLATAGGKVFNVGGDEENYLISTLGELVEKLFPEVQVETLETATDQRSYKVAFSKIRRELGFTPEKTVKDGMEEIREALKEGKFTDTEDKKYYNHLV